MVFEALAESIEALGRVQLSRPDYKVRGVHLDATLPPERLRAVAQLLRDGGFLIEDATCVDAAPERMAIYHFAHPKGPCRVALRVLVPREAGEVPSIHEIFPGADWHERETHEFFGLVFSSHPDLSPLILPEDSEGLVPLRKGDADVKPLGAVLPQFGPPAPEGAGEVESERKPRVPKKEKPATPEGEA
jgi:NADH-quinone oxidoreductase subunit C